MVNEDKLKGSKKEQKQIEEAWVSESLYNELSSKLLSLNDYMRKKYISIVLSF